MDSRIDVIVQSYGKGQQLRCTLKSLMLHSKQWIDKIYFIEEQKAPFNDSCEWVKDYFDNIIYHKPNKYVNPYSVPYYQVPEECIRYKWAIDRSDKNWVFVTHNDVLYTGDVIGNMLNEIKKWKLNNPNNRVVACAQLHQCWNCPALEICGGGEKWELWNPSFEDIKKLKLPHIRTRLDNLHPTVPKLMPECRVNEWAALIDRNACIEEKSCNFGDFTEDSTVAWFRAMHLKGYKFIDYRKDFHHAYWANMGGFQVQQKEQVYIDSEQKAKEYFEEHFKI
jgi:hypothetical protein